MSKEHLSDNHECMFINVDHVCDCKNTERKKARTIV